MSSFDIPMIYGGGFGKILNSNAAMHQNVRFLPKFARGLLIIQAKPIGVQLRDNAESILIPLLQCIRSDRRNYTIN